MIDIWERAHDLIEEIMDQPELMRVDADQLGLDRRAGWQLVVYPGADGWIAAMGSSRRTLEYYGGFEYIPEENRIVIGDWTFYLASSDNARVMRCMEYLEDELLNTDGQDEEDAL